MLDINHRISGQASYEVVKLILTLWLVGIAGSYSPNDRTRRMAPGAATCEK